MAVGRTTRTPHAGHLVHGALPGALKPDDNAHAGRQGLLRLTNHELYLRGVGHFFEEALLLSPELTHLRSFPRDRSSQIRVLTSKSKHYCTIVLSNTAALIEAGSQQTIEVNTHNHHPA